MWLTLLDTSCSDLQHYRGLYRSLSQIPDSLRDLEDEYYKKAGETLRLPFSSENLDYLQKLYAHLSAQGWQGDLILHCKRRNPHKPDFALLGYDVCAPSLHYSPIGGGMLSRYDSADSAYTDLPHEAFLAYGADLNEYGLFRSYPMALAFAEYCEHINRKYPQCIESEGGWQPVSILRYTPAEPPLRHRPHREELATL